jgi:hypothetical protein
MGQYAAFLRGVMPTNNTFGKDATTRTWETLQKVAR